MLPSLRSIIAAALGIDVGSLNEESGLDDAPNWDSLRHVVLLTEVERMYDVEFELDQMSKATTVHSIRELLVAKGVQPK